MDRKRHIDTRNLVVCNTFDEFAEKVGQCDQNVEDIVGYVTSVTRVFYWLNVESVWGVLGFTWDVLDAEGTFDNPWDRLEHVIAAGKNIDGEHGELTPEEQKQMDDAIQRRLAKVKGGYGHFNATTLPFTVIPKLPDGYRIREFNHTFDLIESSYIEVQNSDWSNLTEINYLIPRRKSISIDITGANLSSNSKVLINDLKNSGDNLDWKSTVYIKGDLGNCTNGWFEGHINYQWVNSHTIIVDDDNKGLNLPISLYIQNQFYYTNPDKEFDIRNWLKINELTYTDNRWTIVLLAASKKYLIDNKLANDIYATTGTMQISCAASLGVTPESFDDTLTKITDPIAQEIEPCTITYDCTEDGDVREDLMFDMADSLGNRYGAYPYEIQCYNPIIYEGTVNSITMWNPYVIVKDDNSWPQYNQSLVNKLTKFDAGTTDIIIGNNVHGLGQGYFMYGAYLYITKPSPYTIDCTNIRYLNLFDRAKFLISEYSDSFRDIGGNRKALEIVKLTNANNLVSFKIGSSFTTNKPFYFTIPSLKTIFFGTEYPARNRIVKIFIPKETTIELSYISYLWSDSIYIEDFSHTTFRYKYVDCRNYGLRFSMNCASFGYDPAEVGTSTGPINLFAFDNEILQDDAYLKASLCNTFRGALSNRTVIHPLIATNLNGKLYVGVIRYGATEINIQSDFVYIYNTDISLVNYRNFANWQQPFNEFLTKILPNIQENDIEGNVCVISLSTPMYNAIMYDAQYATYKATILALNYSIADSGN